jgi:DNA-binding TFAR19-related protein (PDSD5 family)
MKSRNSAAKPPYPGIRPFAQEDRPFFCGRRAQTDEVVGRLKQHHFSAVIGGSGSGKSSLVRAGVIPDLYGQAIPERGDFWRVVEMSPRDAPLDNLVAALEDVLEPIVDPGQRERRRQRIETNLLEQLSFSHFFDEFRGRLKLDPGLPPELREYANLLVLVDQFEEIFASENAGSIAAQHLVRIIVDAERRKTPGIYVILTMRSEDLHRCAAYLDLPGVLNKAAYLTRRLDEEEIAMAIIRPAQLFCRRHGWLPRGVDRYDDPRPFELPVLRRLLDNVSAINHEPDHLPLLQHTLLLLWRTAVGRRAPARGGDGFTIGLEELAAALGFDSTRAFLEHERRQQPADKAWLLRRALDHAADRRYRGLRPNEQRIAEQMFRLLAHLDNEGQYKRDLTTPEAVRAVAGIAGKNEVDHIIKVFSRPDPFIRRVHPSAPIDVSHEAFIRNWQQFRAWLDDERRAVEGLQTVYRSYADRWAALAATRRPHRWLRYWFGKRLNRDRLNDSKPWAAERSRNDAWLGRYLPGLKDTFGALPSVVTPAEINHRLRRFRNWSRVPFARSGQCSCS